MVIKITGEKRKRSSPYSFLYQSQPICKEMFLKLYGISKSCSRGLLDHYQNHGISLQRHGNSKRLPHNKLPQAVAEDAKNFLSNYVDENAVLLPGRIPGFKSENIQLLSSSDTKMDVWNSFTRTCEEPNKTLLSYFKGPIFQRQTLKSITKRVRLQPQCTIPLTLRNRFIS